MYPVSEQRKRHTITVSSPTADTSDGGLRNPFQYRERPRENVAVPITNVTAHRETRLVIGLDFGTTFTGT